MKARITGKLLSACAAVVLTLPVLGYSASALAWSRHYSYTNPTPQAYEGSSQYNEPPAGYVSPSGQSMAGYGSSQPQAITPAGQISAGTTTTMTGDTYSGARMGISPVVPRGPQDLAYWNEPAAGYESPSGQTMAGYGSSTPPTEGPSPQSNSTPAPTAAGTGGPRY